MTAKNLWILFQTFKDLPKHRWNEVYIFSVGMYKWTKKADSFSFPLHVTSTDTVNVKSLTGYQFDNIYNCEWKEITCRGKYFQHLYFDRIFYVAVVAL